MALSYSLVLILKVDAGNMDMVIYVQGTLWSPVSLILDDGLRHCSHFKASASRAGTGSKFSSSGFGYRAWVGVWLLANRAWTNVEFAVWKIDLGRVLS